MHLEEHSHCSINTVSFIVQLQLLEGPLRNVSQLPDFGNHVDHQSPERRRLVGVPVYDADHTRWYGLRPHERVDQHVRNGILKGWCAAVIAKDPR